MLVADYLQIQDQLQAVASKILSINDVFSQPGERTVNQQIEWLNKAGQLKEDLSHALSDTYMATQ